jgi:DNA-binding NtrC family response regulator/tetratricopeptide (TPR) repeat protein
VRAPSDAHDALIAHAARRLRTSGFATFEGLRAGGSPIFREIAARAGVTVPPLDAEACAEAIVHALPTPRAALVFPLPAEGTWDHAVAVALSRAPNLLLFATTEAQAEIEPHLSNARIFDVAPELSTEDKLKWLSAIAEEALSEVPPTDVRALEAWWRSARQVPALSPSSALTDLSLSAPAQELFDCLMLAERSLPLELLEAFVGADASHAVEELSHAGRITVRGSFALVLPERRRAARSTPASPKTRASTLQVLLGEHPSMSFVADPWSIAQAATLLLADGRFDEADLAMSRALRMSSDPRSSREVSTRWYAAVTAIESPEGLALRISAAERALAMGDAHGARRWVDSADKLAPDHPELALLRCRAMIQLGDLMAARICLTSAEANLRPEDLELRARITAERAEIAYLRSELDDAASLAMQAAEAVQDAPNSSTLLAARSTLGKVLLARGEWERADEHFAEDALVAARTGETTGELRARLNRGIALLSRGRLDEARTVLEHVLEDGTRLGEDRARAFALSNLGLVAYRQHDFGSALRYWDETVRFPQALRGKLATALTLANLADLRLRLGLIEHAEHALVFGKKLLSGSAPPRTAALFKWVAAQVALERGNTDLARREIESALVDAHASGHRDCLESAYVVSARVALEDGDLERARQALEAAERIAESLRARAELAILEAKHARALGHEAIAPSIEALQLARQSGDEDLLAEIHALLAMTHRDAGNTLEARSHLTRALAVRDQVARGLSPDIRAAYLAKPAMIALSRLEEALTEAAVPTETLANSTRVPREPMAPGSSVTRLIVGNDPAIVSLVAAIRKVARSTSTVLIHGESGTGKELVAEALHRESDRASGPLVSVNCAALAETLLLSELFGHEKGAFTGASSRRRGRFEMAEGGTLFLDEIGDISPRTQVALLRVLQEKTFERVGGVTPLRANVRVVCATHRDLRAMVERGEFREDLYYRLRGISLEVPALRARIGDMPKLAEHLLTHIARERGEATKRLTTDAIELLCRHKWPGNIRELDNALRAVTLFTETLAISAEDLVEHVDDLRNAARTSLPPNGPVTLRAPTVPPPAPLHCADPDEDPVAGTLPDGETMATAMAYAHVRQGAASLSTLKRQIERDCIARALQETDGNITRAAAILGMKRPRLSQLVKQYGLAAANSEVDS